MKLLLVAFLLMACSASMECPPLGPLAVRAQQSSTPAGGEISRQQSTQAPSFALPDLRNRQHKAADLRRNIVVLDFWATWCEPCIAEISSLNRLQEKYGSSGLRVVGVAVQSGWRKDIKRFADKHDMRYTILVGTDDTVADFEVISFPTTFLIAPGWRVCKKYIGAYEGKDAEIDRDIKSLLEDGR